MARPVAGTSGGDGKAGRRLLRFGQRVLDALLPPRCVGCRREGALLCDACVTRARPLDEPFRPGGAPGPLPCLTPSASLGAVMSCFAMDGAIREAVHDLKYRGVRALAPVMGSLLAQRAKASATAFDALVPVPLHPQRLRERGYNQAELLAIETARGLGLPVRAGALARVRHTPPLARTPGLDGRRAAVRRAFETRQRLDGLRLLVVDDVCTSGATLDACAEALAGAGAASVWGLTFAREL